MQPLRIYLADLTYTTLSIATEAFPLNIGYVAAYRNKVFGERVELSSSITPKISKRRFRRHLPTFSA